MAAPAGERQRSVPCPRNRAPAPGPSPVRALRPDPRPSSSPVARPCLRHGPGGPRGESLSLPRSPADRPEDPMDEHPVALMRRRTKIVATVGPASREPAVLDQLLRAGVNVFRLNFSHGDHAEHGTTYARVRAAAEAAGQP